jgi:hypothetical protein
MGQIRAMLQANPDLSFSVIADSISKSPGTLANNIRALEIIDNAGLTPENQREQVHIVTRFPPIGAAESDYQQYALVERAESAEHRVEQLQGEVEKLHQQLEKLLDEKASNGGRGEVQAGTDGESRKIDWRGSGQSSDDRESNGGPPVTEDSLPIIVV